MLTAAFFFWLLGFVLFARLPRVGSERDRAAVISVVIPARNEEANVGRLIESLRAQDPPAHEIILVDDDSTDATAARAREAGAAVLVARPLPEGWAGKPWACWQGAQHATGEQLLFLDADTWLVPDALPRLAAAFREAPGLLSVQPYHAMQVAHERLGAFFNLITMIGTGAFTLLGSRIGPRIAFGPCVMVEREPYMAVGGHGSAAGSVVEGAGLAEAYTNAGHTVRCLGGRDSVNFRMYPGGLRSMVEGLAKSFATGAGAVPVWLLVPTVAWVVGGVTTIRHLVVGSLGDPQVALTALVLGVLYAMQLRWMLGRIGNYGWWPALLYPLPILFFVGVFALSLFRTFVRGKVPWKGRSVSVR